MALHDDDVELPRLPKLLPRFSNYPKIQVGIDDDDCIDLPKLPRSSDAPKVSETLLIEVGNLEQRKEELLDFMKSRKNKYGKNVFERKVLCSVMGSLCLSPGPLHNLVQGAILESLSKVGELTLKVLANGGNKAAEERVRELKINKAKKEKRDRSAQKSGRMSKFGAKAEIHRLWIEKHAIPNEKVEESVDSSNDESLKHQ